VPIDLRHELLDIAEGRRDAKAERGQLRVRVRVRARVEIRARARVRVRVRVGVRVRVRVRFGVRARVTCACAASPSSVTSPSPHRHDTGSSATVLSMTSAGVVASTRARTPLGHPFAAAYLVSRSARSASASLRPW